MKKMHVTSVFVNRSFAFVKGNRPTNSKAVTAKMKSIEEYGLLSPITVVDGEQVITSGGHLVDLNGKDISRQPVGELLRRAGRSAPIDCLY